MTLAAMARRLAGIFAFVLIMAPFLVVAVVTLLCAGAWWIATGEDADPILMNPVLGGIADFPAVVGGWRDR
jgi:hypothetical protein